MKTLFVVIVSFILAAGCARVQVAAPKEPIKVDISMRLDVYQHVRENIDEIESIVAGEPNEPQSKAGQSLLNIFVEEAYAADGLSPEVERAALRRRDRRAQLVSWQVKGVVGENCSGLVEIRDEGAADALVQALVSAENADRMIIYQELAAGNGTSIDEVKRIYAERLQADAASGTPIEVQSGSGYEWIIKN
ncbi:MAG: DUF1318 domain-containing protein [Candidatus Omnitrophica bacterium]|nr:DUF1318 domain-containing protein [Candidatus Omnitrophota bacterium]